MKFKDVPDTDQETQRTALRIFGPVGSGKPRDYDAESVERLSAYRMLVDSGWKARNAATFVGLATLENYLVAVNGSYVGSYATPEEAVTWTSSGGVITVVCR
jgi:hypothetical protein